MLQKDHSYLCGKHSHYSKAILGDLKKHFYHELPESFSDNRLILLERRRATLSRQCCCLILYMECTHVVLHVCALNVLFLNCWIVD